MKQRVLTGGDFQFRPSGRSNRSGRSQADHDVFEGLPIKQWRHSESIVGLPHAVVGEKKPGDNAWPEPPLPRDTHLLSPWTQALLREARKPRLAKRKEPTEDEKGDEEEDGEKEMQTGFLAKKWAHVPAHLEEPEREYVAKRRKGLPSLHTTLALQAAVNISSTAPTRKARVMKADAEGKTTVYEVLVAEGQVVEGEIQNDTEMPDAAPERAAPGTVIDGVGIANAEGVIVANDLLQPQLPPPRRRTMPPKRVKKGGPGRGKKKVMFTADRPAGNATPGGTGAPSTPGAGDSVAGEPMDIDSVRKEDDEGEDDDEDDDREDGEVSDAEAGPDETPSRPRDTGLPSDAPELPHKPVDEAMEEPINHSVSETVKEPVTESVDEPDQVTADEPSNGHIDAPIKESVDEPTTESVDEPTTDSIDEPTTESIDEPAEELNDGPLDEPVGESVDAQVKDTQVDQTASDMPLGALAEPEVATPVEDASPTQDTAALVEDTAEAETAEAANTVDTAEAGTPEQEDTVITQREPTSSPDLPLVGAAESLEEFPDGPTDAPKDDIADEEVPSTDDKAPAETLEEVTKAPSKSNDAFSGLEAALNNQDDDDDDA